MDPNAHGEPELLPSPTSPTYTPFSTTSASPSITGLVPSSAGEIPDNRRWWMKQPAKPGKNSTESALESQPPPSQTRTAPSQVPQVPPEPASPVPSSSSSSSADSTTPFEADIEKTAGLPPSSTPSRTVQPVIEEKKKFSFSLRRKKGVRDILPARLYKDRHNSISMIHITAFGTAFVVAGLLGGLFYWMVNKDNHDNVQ
ncbi:hypothetical protein L202_01838 [Cryptococcus amylolentus CBS 6039]|uniref:Uncharacterized protein n=2 Tax=Cryptococcus amylolentus TaxID=104669 RepID=A0A1E3I7D7_9TREE|nr:hypothetical protein L202_01838 [Cryptococcus amylolentus CBS 6039]ODN83746.1 hypothetical protein L202_01838 [Cryptococcus amylolentus CBS 6039]ODO11212.1 hypothetical protein I350_01816 [Cryptococcus amylolentus CBS 6273]